MKKKSGKEMKMENVSPLITIVSLYHLLFIVKLQMSLLWGLLNCCYRSPLSLKTQRTLISPVWFLWCICCQNIKDPLSRHYRYYINHLCGALWPVVTELPCLSVFLTTVFEFRSGRWSVNEQKLSKFGLASSFYYYFYYFVQ